MTTDLSLVISVRVLLCNEFVVFLCLTARGSSRERSHLLFSLCDLDRVGGVTFKNLMKVLESINKLGKATEHYSLNIKILVHIPKMLRTIYMLTSVQSAQVKTKFRRRRTFSGGILDYYYI